MRRVLLSLAALVIALLAGTKAVAYDCEVDGIYYYRITATELEVANKVFSDQNRTAYTGSVTIPSTVTYNGKTFNVTSIGEYAFRDCSQLTSVTIPSSVTVIKGHAFYNCSQIASITLPTGVASIGEGAFEGCSSLSQVNIPSGVPAIENETFYDCTSLRMVVIPASVASIGDNAFSRCASLISIYLEGKSAPAVSPNAFVKVDRTWCTLYVPKDVKEAYEQDKSWHEFFMEGYAGKWEDLAIPDPTK